MVKDRLRRLREKMGERGIDCAVIPTADDHNSEYVCEYFRVREYFSGFTGSAGTLAVFADKAALFTDGRYFIQAQRQLAGSGIELVRMGEPGVPRIEEYIGRELPSGGNVGFDGRVVTAGSGAKYEEAAAKRGGRAIWDFDPAEDIWAGRPGLPATPVWRLAEEYAGEDAASKLSRLREKMQNLGAGAHILTTLDDIAWLLNLRAYDVAHCPVFLAFLTVTETEACLYADDRSFSDQIRSYLADLGVSLKPYGEFYAGAAALFGSLPPEKGLLLSKKQAGFRLLKELEAAPGADGDRIIDKPNPSSLMKAVKNATEQENLHMAHIYDGIAVTRFMYWLKKNVGLIPMDEISAADELERLRRENPGLVGLSFPTICAYGANGAIVHYSASPESSARIVRGGMLLVDSGGHYLEGSTDVTRTFVLGDVPARMKRDFTLVACAMLRLMDVRFLSGCTGANLDYAAREIFWRNGLDYKHGTGHGVGYLLDVHEGPNGFRYKLTDEFEPWTFEEGMVTTDEPGLYIEGSHGVRIENELICRKGEQNGYGQFLRFENLTFVPIDLDGIDKSFMEPRDVSALNAYHRDVFAVLSPYFEGEELAWLREATREI